VQLARRHPHLTGVGLDLPALAPVFEEHVAAAGLSERLRFLGGDFLVDELPAAEVLVFGHVLHDWGLDTKRLLIGKAYRALPEGGAIICYDAVIDDERRHNAFGLLMSLNMLIELPGGFDYTGAQCQRWLREAGFRRTYVEHLAGARVDGRWHQVAAAHGSGRLTTNLLWRSPVLVARAAAAIDQVSGGRFELGLGAGAFDDQAMAGVLKMPPGDPGRQAAGLRRGAGAKDASRSRKIPSGVVECVAEEPFVGLLGWPARWSEHRGLDDRPDRPVGCGARRGRGGLRPRVPRQAARSDPPDLGARCRAGRRRGEGLWLEAHVAGDRPQRGWTVTSGRIRRD
jgi:O-methyltransferase domain/Luciferase-like monooxygenase